MLRSDVLGRLDGEWFCAGATVGDGACLLHARFGFPNAVGHLEAEAARERLLLLLPRTTADVRGALGVRAGDSFGPVLASLWCELTVPAAAAILETGSSADIQREAGLYWSCLPEDLRETVLEFEAHRRHETALAESADAQLRTLFRDLFTDRCEATVVRPLAARLGCLPSSEVDFASLPVEEALILHGRHGLDSATSLLLPAVADTTVSKYRALFQSEHIFDPLRMAFFFNSAYGSANESEELSPNAEAP